MGTWLEKYSDQFNQPPEFVCLKKLVEYIQLHMPGSDLEHRAFLLLAELEDMETMRAKTEGEEGWDGSIQAHEDEASGWVRPGPYMSLRTLSWWTTF